MFYKFFSSTKLFVIGRLLFAGGQFNWNSAFTGYLIFKTI
jgi:hypothetical protein